jgi:hypothetical protein
MMALFLVLINSLHCFRKFLTEKKNFLADMREKQVKQFAVHFSNQFHNPTFIVAAGGDEEREKLVIELRDFLISSAYSISINYFWKRDSG